MGSLWRLGGELGQIPEPFQHSPRSDSETIRAPSHPQPRSLGLHFRGPRSSPLQGTAVRGPKRTHSTRSMNLPQNTFWMLRPLGSAGQRDPRSGPPGAPSLVVLPCGSQHDKLLDTSPNKWRHPGPLLLNTGLHNSLLTHRQRWHRHHVTSKAQSPKGTRLLLASPCLSETLGTGAPS